MWLVPSILNCLISTSFLNHICYSVCIEKISLTEFMLCCQNKQGYVEMGAVWSQFIIYTLLKIANGKSEENLVISPSLVARQNVTRSVALWDFFLTSDPDKWLSSLTILVLLLHFLNHEKGEKNVNLQSGKIRYTKFLTDSWLHTHQ